MGGALLTLCYLVIALHFLFKHVEREVPLPCTRLLLFNAWQCSAV